MNFKGNLYFRFIISNKTYFQNGSTFIVRKIKLNYVYDRKNNTSHFIAQNKLGN